jgi:hypothetical protein
MNESENGEVVAASPGDEPLVINQEGGPASYKEDVREYDEND